MVYEFLGLLVESYGTWLLLHRLVQRLVDASKDSDIPKNVPFAFAINNQNTEERSSEASGPRRRRGRRGQARSLAQIDGRDPGYRHNVDQSGRQ
jgi:hypothetical protein